MDLEIAITQMEISIKEFLYRECRLDTEDILPKMGIITKGKSNMGELTDMVHTKVKV
jgi:hypothetical protein